MDLSLHIDDSHFEFLKLQKGNLDEFAHDRAAWHGLYEADLQRQYESIAPHLPAECHRLLDVGSGLGGIDILIRRHYESLGHVTPFVWLLDGEDDAAKMNLHRETFNDMRVAKDFHVKNGLHPQRFSYWTPTTIRPGPVTPYDLIVSFGSWCFHYPPSTYLGPLLNSGIHAGTVLILDVRSTKASYMWELEEVFETVEKIAQKPKWQRWVFRVKP